MLARAALEGVGGIALEAVVEDGLMRETGAELSDVVEKPRQTHLGKVLNRVQIEWVEHRMKKVLNR